MLRCVGGILLLLLLLILAHRLVESVFSEKVFGTLHETTSLPCPVNCTAGVLVWRMFQKPDEDLVRCEDSSCSSEKGFRLPAEQYLKGNSSLTLLTADYKLRGLYVATCDSETICQVVFTLFSLQTTRVINPGDPIDVRLPFTDLVEVTFNPSGSGQPSDLQVCTIVSEKIKWSSDYKERASLSITLQIKDGNVSDFGNYTVRDTVNDEIIAVVNVQMRAGNQGSGAAPGSNNILEFKSEEKSYADYKQEMVIPVWGIVLIIVLIVVLLLIIVVLIVVIIYLVKRNQQLQREPAANGHPPQSNGTASYTAGEEQVMLPDSQNHRI